MCLALGGRLSRRLVQGGSHSWASRLMTGRRALSAEHTLQPGTGAAHTTGRILTVVMACNQLFGCLKRCGRVGRFWSTAVWPPPPSKRASLVWCASKTRMRDLKTTNLAFVMVERI